MPISKGIYLSYALADKQVALELYKVLEGWFKDQIWIRDFDLEGGEIIANAIDDSLLDAKWFILFFSSAAVTSSWVKHEVDIATIRSIEDLGFKILVLKLDNTPFPQRIDFALKTQTVVDLSSTRDVVSEFLNIADYISKTDVSLNAHSVYVDRGDSTDRFSLLTRSRIIFILGLTGIGKTAFVHKSVSTTLKKNPLSITLTRGHSTDLLARQVLQVAHGPQPLGTDVINDERLVRTSLQALKNRADKYFLFLDNAQEALDPYNQLLPFLGGFLDAFLKAEINTHVILATSRNPDYSAALASSTDLLMLPLMEDPYIAESIRLWLEGQVSAEGKFMQDIPNLNEIVSLAGGFPIAARLIASFLSVKQSTELLVPKQRKRIQLNLAEYIIRSSDTSALLEIDRLILLALALLREPVLVSDLLSIRTLTAKYTLDDIHESRSRLSNLFLIEQTGELMYLHDLVRAYYQDLVERGDMQDFAKQVAIDFGGYAFGRALSLNRDVINLIDDGVARDTKVVIQISNAVLRYAVPAERLLRSVGDARADQLPIQTKGTLREMVFYFYQEKKDYKQALAYAEKWLKIYPLDYDVKLYQARCYRNIRHKDGLSKASAIISQLQEKSSGKLFAARLFRERGLIAEYQGEYAEAKSYYRQGINLDANNPYPEIIVSLARLLLEEADKLPDWDPEKTEKTAEALRMLERARSQSAQFDRFHLGTYVEALVQTGREDVALPLMLDALLERPTDGRLNFRMAELKKRQGDLESAEKYARIALQNGNSDALITLTDIACDRAQLLDDGSHFTQARDQLAVALEWISTYKSDLKHRQEVADTLKARILRMSGDWLAAGNWVTKYEGTENTYTLYEQCLYYFAQADQFQHIGSYQEALSAILNAIARLIEFRRELTDKLSNMLDVAYRREANYRKILEDSA